MAKEALFCFSSCTLVLLSVAATILPTRGPSDALPLDQRSVLPRWYDPKRANVVFVAGVEGSGHHFLEKVIQQIPHSNVWIAFQWREGGKWKPPGKLELTERLAKLENGSVCVFHGGSYPVGRSHRTDPSYLPQMPWIEEVATEAGVNFHVIILQRKFEDCLIADCVHRRFEECSQQCHTLQFAGEVLVDQLKLLKSSLVSCFRYGNIRSMTKAVKDNFPESQDTLIKSLWDQDSENYEPDDPSKWREYVDTMSGAEARVEEACRQAREVDLSAFHTIMSLRGE